MANYYVTLVVHAYDIGSTAKKNQNEQLQHIARGSFASLVEEGYRRGYAHPEVHFKKYQFSARSEAEEFCIQASCNLSGYVGAFPFSEGA